MILNLETCIAEKMEVEDMIVLTKILGTPT